MMLTELDGACGHHVRVMETTIVYWDSIGDNGKENGNPRSL